MTMKKTLPKIRIIFNVQKEINPNFRIVWQSKLPNHVLKGGRNSFKSSTVSMKLTSDLLEHINRKEKVNIIVVRKVGNTIRDSVFQNFLSFALPKFGIRHQFKSTVAPYKITHIKTGSAIHFYGQDDFSKLKSNAIDNVIAVWYEEAAEFESEEEFDQTNATFMRNKFDGVPFVKFFYTYNPPRNPYNWINEWAEKLKDEADWLVHESNYLDDELGFVTDQMLADIDRIKRNDYDYYRYLYLGEPVGLGTNVYNIDLFKRLDDVPSDERIVYLYFTADSGHQQSATTCSAIALTNKRKVIVLDTYYYSPARKHVKKAPSDLSKDLHEFQKDIIERYNFQSLRQRTIDSAEGALRNEYYKLYGIRWNPVKKLKKVDMTSRVQSLLAQGRVYYLPTKNNVEYFIGEHKRYMWDEKTIRNENPAVVKTDDHTCDSFQYFVMDNSRDLELIA